MADNALLEKRRKPSLEMPNESWMSYLSRFPDEVRDHIRKNWTVQNASNIPYNFGALIYEAARNGKNVVFDMTDPNLAPNPRHPTRTGDAWLSSRAADLAMDIAAPSFTVRAPPGALRTFGGMKAKNADLKALTNAQEMAKAGKPREDIWSETGWFQGPDQKWRFEIDDSKMRLVERMPQDKDGNYRSGSFNELVSHPDLEIAYPFESRSYMTLERSRDGTYGGSYKERNLGGTIKAKAPDADTARRVAAHEMQHSVQGAEDFARGGSPANYAQGEDAEFARNIMSWRKEMDYMRREFPDWTDAQREKYVEDIYRDLSDDKHYNRRGGMAEAKRYWRDTENNPDDQLNELIKRYELDRRVSLQTPMQMYKRLAGEVEARAVERRLDMTDAERRARPPWLDYDVPESEQILRFGDVGGGDYR